MYIFNSDFKRTTKNKNISKQYLNKWINGLSEIIECIDHHEDNEIIDSRFDEDREISINFDNMILIIEDFIKTLAYLKKQNIAIHKTSKRLKSFVGKIITRQIFVLDIDLNHEDILYLLNFIEWNLSFLFCHCEDWHSDEIHPGYDAITMIEMALHHKTKLTGLDNEQVIYFLLVGIQAGNTQQSKLVQKFIVSNKIKIPSSLFEEFDKDYQDIELYDKIKKLIE